MKQRGGKLRLINGIGAVEVDKSSLGFGSPQFFQFVDLILRDVTRTDLKLVRRDLKLFTPHPIITRWIRPWFKMIQKLIISSPSKFNNIPSPAKEETCDPARGDATDSTPNPYPSRRGPSPRKHDTATPQHCSNSPAQIPTRMSFWKHNCNIPRRCPPMDFQGGAVPDWIDCAPNDGPNETPLPRHRRNCKTTCSIRHSARRRQGRESHSTDTRRAGGMVRRNVQHNHHLSGRTLLRTSPRWPPLRSPRSRLRTTYAREDVSGINKVKTS